MSGVSFLATALLMGVTALVGRRLGKVSVVDTAWGLGFVVVAAVSATVGEGSGSRRLLLVVLVAIWGLRLAWHLHRRNRGKGEDPRYAAMLAGVPGNPFLVAVRRVFAVQGLAIWFVSLPLQVSGAAGPGAAPVVAVGVLLWAAGLLFEGLGDRQLREFKADPANRGKVMDRGLWAWTRHPNYFGDACVWWGLYLVAASAWPGVLTLLSPVAMTYFLVFATGARLLERHLQERPGYAAYQARTGYFLPRPPRHRASGAE